MPSTDDLAVDAASSRRAKCCVESAISRMLSRDEADGRPLMTSLASLRITWPRILSNWEGRRGLGVWGGGGGRKGEEGGGRGRKGEEGGEGGRGSKRGVERKGYGGEGYGGDGGEGYGRGCGGCGGC